MLQSISAMEPPYLHGSLPSVIGPGGCLGFAIGGP